MRCQVLNEEDAAELGMGSFLGVAQGSDEPATFIVMEHNPGREDLDTVVLVGKGITFDTGGISLKPVEKMDRMRGDMGGGAAVLATMLAVGQLDLPLHVVGLVPATENMPSARAYKPGDVLTAMNGKTIEVISTDAEGRLILADALAYAARFEPKAVVDLATLTGACVVALGRGRGRRRLQQRRRAAGAACRPPAEASGERIWPMPLFDDYLDSLESLTADLANSRRPLRRAWAPRPCSSSSSPRATPGSTWTSPACPSRSGPARPSARPHLQKGGTGFGVRLLVQFLRDWVQS